MKIKSLFIHIPLAALTLTGASACILAGAYAFQYLGGLQPCTLCLYQRMPHAIVIVLGVFAFVLRTRPKRSAFVIALIGLTCLAGSALAFYHAGVEQHWWVSVFEGCSNPMLSGKGDLLSRIQNSAAVRCDTVPWQMLGISMAGYNGILSLAMSLYAFAAALLITRRANGF